MKRLFFIVAALFVVTPLIGQDDYLKLQANIDSWVTSIKKELIIPMEKSTKTIQFSEYGYSITGYFKKGIWGYGSWVVLYGPNNSYKLYGVVTGESSIKGVKEESNGICTYGTFNVSNTIAGFVTSKVKIATELQINEIDVQYYKGYYNDCPTILSLSQSCIAVDGKTAGRSFVGLYCPLKKSDINSIGYQNLKELLLTADKECRMEWSNNHKFSGNISATLMDDGYIQFRRFIGEESNTPDGCSTLSVKRSGEFVRLLKVYKPDNNIVSEELIVPTSLISDENLWNRKMFYQNATEIHYKYKDNTSYKGKFEVEIVDSEDGQGFMSTVTITYGTYTFSNGDVFAGNLSGQYYGGVPINGTMKFIDGTYAYGNWLLKYELTQPQINSLASKKYPTEIRKQAEKYQHSNTYVTYENPVDGWNDGINKIEYFSPGIEDLSYTRPSYILQNKKTGWYICKFISQDTEVVTLEFKVDSYGRHIEEITYDYTEDSDLPLLQRPKVPKYINVLTWHSNGAIKSIKTYHYNTQEIYLVINFFSDGSFKNAYMYGRGNSGKNILRRSKESHPTFGGFSTRLYDLDGNYEKTINWNIGESSSFFGGSGWRDLSPAALDLKKFKIVE